MPNYRNPNGYGSVVKLSGRRRRPYMVRKTVGYDDRAYPIYQVIGYYPSRKDAVLALAKYNNNPYDLDMAKYTLKELYDCWSEACFPKMGDSLKNACRAAFKFCSTLYDVPYRNIKKMQMQACIDNCGKGYATQTNIKNLFSHLDKFAFDNDIIEKCYSTNLTVAPKEVAHQRVIFTDAEVQKLWKHKGEAGVDEALFMLYTGCRVAEMLTIEVENVDLENGIMRGGVKTASGKNRTIPIHPKILPIVQSHMTGKYLFSKEFNKLASLRRAFDPRWANAMSLINAKHTTHECRHTFRSKLDSAGANKVCIDRIMGHKSQDVGEDVYTHKSVDELKQAIELLNYDNRTSRSVRK